MADNLDWSQFNNEFGIEATSSENNNDWDAFNNEFNIETPKLVKEEKVNSEPSINTDMPLYNQTFSEELSNTKDALNQVNEGMNRIPLAMGKIAEDAFNWVSSALGGPESEFFEESLQKTIKNIEDYENRNKEQSIHPATLGEIASGVGTLPNIAINSVKGAATFGTAGGSLAAVSEDGNYDNVGKGAALGLALSAGGYKLIDKVERVIGSLSPEAKIMIDKNASLKEPEIIELLKDVPKEDQAYVLANMVPDDYVKYFTTGVRDKDFDALKARADLRARTETVLNTLGNVDKQLDEASSLYSDMVKVVADKNKNLYSFSGVIDEVDKLAKRYAGIQDKSSAIVNRMKADLEEGKGMMDISTALQFRQDLNTLLSKSKSGLEKISINNIKNSIDNFISNNVDPVTLEKIDNAIVNYRRANNNKDFQDIIIKNSQGKHQGFEGGTNWEKVKSDLKDAKLSSPEVNSAIDIVNVFQKQFKNDNVLYNKLSPEGIREDQAGALSTSSYIINQLKNTFALWGDRHDALKIQEAIKKSIRKTKDPRELYNAMSKNNIPDSIIKQVAEPFLQLEYKMNGKSSILYGTSTGEISSDASKATLAKRTKELGDKATKEMKDTLPTVGKDKDKIFESFLGLGL